MAEKPPPFVVNDRRKFTAEGDIREGYTPPPPPPPIVEMPAPAPSTGSATAPEATPTSAPMTSAKVVTFPNRSTVEADEPGLDAFTDVANTPGSYDNPGAGYDVDGDGLSSDYEADEAAEAEIGPPPTAAEHAAQQNAYQQSARQMDALLQQANPGMKAPAAVGFEHIVQSFYLSAIMAMGAGTEPNQKPRIDILGARQAIDMLNVLEEKTRGNLDEKEQRLLQGVTFELRMMFLELTNAIAAQAHQPPPGRK